MKKIFLFAIALVPLLTGGFFAYKFIRPQLGMQTYDQKGIYFKYPSDWVVWEGSPDFSKHMPIAQIVLVKNNRQSTSFGVNMEKMAGSKLNIEESLVVLETRLQEAMDDFEKVGYQNPTISGETAIDLTFEYSLKEAQGVGGWTKWYGIQRQVIFFRNGALYYLIFTSAPEDFERDSRDFDRIIESFESLEGGED